jgi:hypothetical protein
MGTPVGHRCLAWSLTKDGSTWPSGGRPPVRPRSVAIPRPIVGDRAGEDIWQHREDDLDGENDWIFYDARFERATSDDQLLRFLAETGASDLGGV